MTSISTLLTQMNEDYVRDANYKIWNQNSQTRAIQKWYIQVQSDMQREAPENESNQSITAVIWTQSYSLATDFTRIKLVRFNGDILRETSQKAIKMQYETMTSGIPDSYYLYWGLLYVHPIPNETGTIEVDYYASAPLVAVWTDSTLPTDFNDAICLFWAYKLMQWVGKAELAQMYRGDYMAEIMKLRAKYWLNDENIAWKDGTHTSMVSEKGIGYNE